MLVGGHISVLEDEKVLFQNNVNKLNTTELYMVKLVNFMLCAFYHKNLYILLNNTVFECILKIIGEYATKWL